MKPLNVSSDGDDRANHDSQVMQERFVASVEQGIADADAGRTISDDELGAALDEAF